MTKVKALHTFAHSTAVSGLRSKGEVFECSAEEVETLNAIHDFDLVEVIKEEKNDEGGNSSEDDEKNDEGENSSEDDEKKPKKKGTKKPKVSASDSDSGEVSAD